MTTLYKKNGRKYVPVAEERDREIWPAGIHIVISKPGLCSFHFKLPTENIPLRAAILEKKDRITDALLKALEVEPPRGKLTKIEKKKFDELKEVLGERARMLSHKSVNDVAEKIIDALCKP